MVAKPRVVIDGGGIAGAKVAHDKALLQASLLIIGWLITPSGCTWRGEALAELTATRGADRLAKMKSMVTEGVLRLP